MKMNKDMKEIVDGIKTNNEKTVALLESDSIKNMWMVAIGGRDCVRFEAANQCSVGYASRATLLERKDAVRIALTVRNGAGEVGVAKKAAVMLQESLEQNTRLLEAIEARFK